jgi:hypothetical protein
MVLVIVKKEIHLSFIYQLKRGYFNSNLPVPLFTYLKISNFGVKLAIKKFLLILFFLVVSGKKRKIPCS